MPTQQATQLAIPSSSLAWPDSYMHKNSGLAMRDQSWEVANHMACCVGIISSGLQYRFSSSKDGDIDIDHNDGDL